MNPAGRTDNWFTPMALFEPLHAQYRFTLDPCGDREAPVTQKIGRHFSERSGANGLDAPWIGERVFCNPPYSDIAPWVEKAEREILDGCPLVVMLVPANRTEQPWWQKHVEGLRDLGPLRDDLFTVRTKFLPKRMRFGFPGSPDGAGGHQSTFGCVLVTWEAK